RLTPVHEFPAQQGSLAPPQAAEATLRSASRITIAPKEPFITSDRPPYECGRNRSETLILVNLQELGGELYSSAKRNAFVRYTRALRAAGKGSYRQSQQPRRRRNSRRVRHRAR